MESIVLEKNFNNCPFKLRLPIVQVNGRVFIISADIIRKPSHDYNMVIAHITVEDLLGKRQTLLPVAPVFPVGANEKSFVVSSGADETRVMISNSVLSIYIFTEKYKKYTVHYSIDKERKVRLKGVTITNMDSKDCERLEEALIQKNNHSSTTAQLPDTPEGSFWSNPTLDTYVSALDTEIRHLRKAGGRKFQVTNGKRITRKGDLIYYFFDLEAELFLAEDSPIVLFYDGMSSAGTVQICEEFRVVLAVEKDFGERINTAYFSVEPWKLLDAMKIQLSGVKYDNAIVRELLDRGPALAKPYLETDMAKGQQVAEKRALDERVTVVWGPPGTGKTYTMAKIAINAMRRKMKVLIVSHSNISVDGVIGGIVSQIEDERHTDLLSKGKILRYGYVRDNTLSQNKYAVAYNYVLLMNPELDKQLQELQSRRELLLKRKGQYTSEVLDIDKRLKRIRIEVRDREKQFVRTADILATTISKVTVDKVFEDANYDVVMFDEVSMAYVPQIICAAIHARKHLICVGDFRQLAPIAQSSARNVLEVDIFTYLGITKSDGSLCYHPWLVMLDEQRRMHPDISAFPNRYIYNHLLKDHESVENNRKIAEKCPFPEHALYMVDTSGTYCAAMKNSDNSRFNVLSAIITFLTALEAEKSGGGSVGIITPYAAQTRMLRALIMEYRKNNKTNISCATVHQFQGSERDVIIFDATEDFPFTGPGWLMGKNQNGSVTRLVNVAVTRARGKFITVADYRFWKKNPDKDHTLFYKLVDYIMCSKNVSKTNGLQTDYLYKKHNNRQLQAYNDEDKAVKKLVEDIKQAKDRIVISIPDGELDIKTEGEIIEELFASVKRNVVVLCKTNDYVSLPDKWKMISQGTENATFPVIIIDDSIFWYGMPASRGTFNVGQYGYSTVIHSSYRIEGKHIIDVFKSLSDFDYITVNGWKRPLNSKVQPTGSKAVGGLYEYIWRYEKCPKCRKQMRLVKSSRGKFYLKCSTCSNTELVSVNMVNRYISEDHISCPDDHCEIQAKLGRYGVYIKCDAGHTLKIDQI